MDVGLHDERRGVARLRMLFAFRRLRRRARRRRCRRNGRRGRRADRLQLRQACRRGRCGRDVAHWQTVAFMRAVDGRIFDLPRVLHGYRLVDLPGVSVERARIEIDVHQADRLSDRGADRPRVVEGGGLDGAERRSDQMPARRGAALARHERSKILITDRRRHQGDAKSAEPEARSKWRAYHPDTRSHNHPYANTRNTQRVHGYGKASCSGSNATGLSIVGLTLRRR